MFSGGINKQHRAVMGDLNINVCIDPEKFGTRECI